MIEENDQFELLGGLPSASGLIHCRCKRCGERLVRNVIYGPWISD